MDRLFIDLPIVPACAGCASVGVGDAAIGRFKDEGAAYVDLKTGFMMVAFHGLPLYAPNAGNRIVADIDSPIAGALVDKPEIDALGAEVIDGTIDRAGDGYF